MCVYLNCGFYMKQRRREGKEVTAIDGFQIAHYCEKKKKMVNEEAEAVLVCSATMFKIFYKLL